MTAVTGAEPIRAALATIEGGVGCHYRLRAEGGLTVEILHALGLVKPIRQRIPTCDEHPCPLRAECRFAARFAEGAGSRGGGRSGRKFRPASLGEAVLGDDALLRQVGAAVPALPLPQRILAALAGAEGGEGLTIFALNTILLEESLAALAADGDPGEAAFGRGDLAASLDLLATLGLVDYDRRAFTLRPVPTEVGDGEG